MKYTRPVDVHDPLSGYKKGTLTLEQDGPEISGSRKTTHQKHEITLSFGSSDVQVYIRETWSGGRYSALRVVSLTTLTHVLLNILDQEMADIANRGVDYTGTQIPTF